MISYNKDGTVTLTDDLGVKPPHTAPNDDNLEAEIIAFFGPTIAPVPASVTPLQMRKALRHLGLKATVDAYVATLDEEAAEEWEYALAIERTNQQIGKAVTAMGWTTEQTDDLFHLAASM
jgi:hypothetical protein